MRNHFVSHEIWYQLSCGLWPCVPLYFYLVKRFFSYSAVVYTVMWTQYILYYFYMRVACIFYWIKRWRMQNHKAVKPSHPKTWPRFRFSSNCVTFYAMQSKKRERSIIIAEAENCCCPAVWNKYVYSSKRTHTNPRWYVWFWYFCLCIYCNAHFEYAWWIKQASKQ